MNEKEVAKNNLLLLFTF